MKIKNTIEQTELGLDVLSATAPVKNYRAPVYRVTLVRDGSVTAEATRETADSPAVVAELVRTLIGDSPQEHLVAICVDARSRVIGVSEVSRGTLSASLVHPRETLRTAILLNAAAFIVAHNHPSGDLEPSEEDLTVNKRLVEAGKLLGIEVLDHIIVAKDSFISFKEKGLM